MAADNKFGPVHAIHGVLHSIKLATDALQQMSGADRQRVFQLDARFAGIGGLVVRGHGNFAEASRWMQTAHQWADAAEYPSLALDTHWSCPTGGAAPGHPHRRRPCRSGYQQGYCRSRRHAYRGVCTRLKPLPFKEKNGFASRFGPR